MAGIATDVCVVFPALAALEAGYEVTAFWNKYQSPDHFKTVKNIYIHDTLQCHAWYM